MLLMNTMRLLLQAIRVNGDGGYLTLASPRQVLLSAMDGRFRLQVNTILLLQAVVVVVVGLQVTD